ncbi:MAG: hypothetical protein AB8B47_02935 [Roseobacter sp.]
MGHHHSELKTLNEDAGDLFKDIEYFATPLNAGHDALGDVQDLLKKPADYQKKLKDVSDTLGDLETVCKSGEWVPEAGAVAKSARLFLGGINSFIGSTANALGQIAAELKPLQTYISDIQKPIDDVWASVGAVEGRIGILEHVTSDLRKRYHDKPPKGIESCAAVLNKGLHPTVTQMNDAKDEANAELHKLDQILDTAWKALSRLLHFSDIIDMAYAALSPLRKAVTAIARVIKQAADYGKAAIESALNGIARPIKSLYKRAKGLVDGVENAVKHMRDKLVNFLFEPVQKAMVGILQQVKDKLTAIPAVQQFRDAMGQVKNQLCAMEKALENQADPCKDTFSGVLTT